MSGLNACLIVLLVVTLIVLGAGIALVVSNAKKTAAAAPASRMDATAMQGKQRFQQHGEASDHKPHQGDHHQHGAEHHPKHGAGHHQMHHQHGSEHHQKHHQHGSEHHQHGAGHHQMHQQPQMHQQNGAGHHQMQQPQMHQQHGAGHQQQMQQKVQHMQQQQQHMKHMQHQPAVDRFQEHMQGKIMSPDEDLPPMPSAKHAPPQNNSRMMTPPPVRQPEASPSEYHARFNMQRDPAPSVNTGEGTGVAEAMWSRNTQFNQKPAGYVS